jgi:hypothetical protein
LAVHVGVVDNGWEEINGLDDGELVRETIDSRVVVGLRADEQVWIGDLWQVAQNLRNPLRRELACSAGARGVVDEAFLAAEK